MFSKDHILHKRGLFSKDSCKRVIDFFEKHPERQKNVEDIKIKKFIEMGIYSTPSEFIFNILSPTMEKAAQEYEETYPLLKNCARWRITDSFKIQKYNPGDAYFVLHAENMGHPFFNDELDRRVLAWMVYLNDVTDVGYTEFPDQRKKFQPRTGDVLVWPAYFTHPHRGIASKTQVKYIMTGWFGF